jgi:hypothetical protein
MAEITGPAVEQALLGAARQIAHARAPRLLWMFLLSVDGGLFEEVAIEVGVVKADAAGNRNWPKLAEVTGAQWQSLREACEARLGRNAERSLNDLPAYGPWLAQRRAWQAANNVNPFPGDGGGAR